MFDWEKHRQHRHAVIADTGQWVGLLDENATPICDMAPIVELQAPETRLEPASLQMTVRVRSPKGVVHPVVDELVAPNLGIDSEGALEPVMNKSRFVAIERAGAARDCRRVFRIVSAKPTGDAQAPSTMVIDGVDMLDMLDALPAQSIPDTWTGGWIDADRDWAGPWVKPRRIQDMKTAVNADGFTLSGAGEETIRALIVRSLAATYRAVGVQPGMEPIVVDPAGSGLASPRVVLRPTDDSIWDTISSPCAAAGVRVTASMWFPGDTWGPGNLAGDVPQVVVRVEQMTEA